MTDVILDGTILRHYMDMYMHLYMLCMCMYADFLRRLECDTREDRAR